MRKRKRRLCVILLTVVLNNRQTRSVKYTQTHTHTTVYSNSMEQFNLLILLTLLKCSLAHSGRTHTEVTRTHTEVKAKYCPCDSQGPAHMLKWFLTPDLYDPGVSSSGSLVVCVCECVNCHMWEVSVIAAARLQQTNSGPSDFRGETCHSAACRLVCEGKIL